MKETKQAHSAHRSNSILYSFMDSDVYMYMITMIDPFAVVEPCVYT